MREVYSIDQACEALEISRRQFFNWRSEAVAAGKLPKNIKQFTLAQVQLIAADHHRAIKDIDAIADAKSALEAEVQALREEVNMLQSRVAGLEAFIGALIMPNRLDLHPVSDSPAGGMPAVRAPRSSGKINLPTRSKSSPKK